MNDERLRRRPASPGGDHDRDGDLPPRLGAIGDELERATRADLRPPGVAAGASAAASPAAPPRS